MSDTNLVPISDPDRGFRVWGKHEIFTGIGPGRIVPNKGDLIYSKVDGFLEVTLVDYTTGLSSTEPARNIFVQPTDDSEASRLIAGGTGRPSESYRAYIDTSVTPHTLTIDSHLHVYNSDAKFIKIFKGTVIEDGIVISRHYDQNGNLLGENIPLERVPNVDSSNVSVLSPVVGYSSESLQDGQTVTAVVYGDNNAKLSVNHLIVQNTAWIRKANPNVRYVTGIELVSPFLSTSDPNMLECPINLPLEHIARTARVHYSDGYVRELPLDGDKFALHGSKSFVSTILGQRKPATLTYYFSGDERGVGSINGDTLHTFEPYTLTTIKVDGAYSVKLFTYPVWIDAVHGYRLEHWLLNLERDFVTNVTNFVEIATNSREFDPLAYGIAQDMIFAIDLSKVDSRFKNYRHLQTTRITLRAPGLDKGVTNWTVQYDRNKEVYGENLKAEVTFVNANLWHLNIANGFNSVEEWLRHVYERTYPLFDETVEDREPTPTHFKIIAGNYIADWPISEWNRNFTINNLMNRGECIYLQFYRRSADTDLQLGVSGLIMRQIN